QNLFGSLSRLLVARIDHRRMDSLVQQKLRPFQNLTCKNYRCSSAISNLIVLSLSNFNKHFRSRVLYVYSSRTVAPSLVIVTSPKLSTIILSIPRGPRVVFTTSETIRAALMLP